LLYKVGALLVVNLGFMKCSIYTQPGTIKGKTSILYLGLRVCCNTEWAKGLVHIPTYNTTNNIWTARLKWRLMLWQMRESMLHQTMHVHIARQFSLLIRPMTFCVITLRNFPPFVVTKRHFRWSKKRVVNMSTTPTQWHPPCNQAQWVSCTPRSYGRTTPGSRVCSRGGLPWGCSGTRWASCRTACTQGAPCGSSGPSPLCTPPKISAEIIHDYMRYHWSIFTLQGPFL